MGTPKQQLGDYGETAVTKRVSCPGCKRDRTLRRLRQNFKCADIICDFCGYLAQVKTHRTSNTSRLPSTIPGAAWGPTEERLNAGIYFPLFVVLVGKSDASTNSIWYLPADLQTREMYRARNPLASTAKRAGWQGFNYVLTPEVRSRFVRIWPQESG